MRSIEDGERREIIIARIMENRIKMFNVQCIARQSVNLSFPGHGSELSLEVNGMISLYKVKESFWCNSPVNYRRIMSTSA